jgi:hypothetical protein
VVLKDAMTAIRTAGERIVRLAEQVATLMRMRGFTQIGAMVLPANSAAPSANCRRICQPLRLH